MNTAFLAGIPGTSATLAGLTPGAGHLWIVQGVDAQGFTSANFAYLFVTNPVSGSVKLNAPTLAADGSFQISAAGAVNQTVQVWATTNLPDPTSWTLLTSFMPTNGVFSFTDPNAGSFPTRFYQVIGP